MRDIQEVQELKHPLLTNKYTHVFHEGEDEMKYGAPHHFIVSQIDGDKARDLARIDFQEGPIKENGVGVNGVANEDVLHMVLARLDAFQRTEFKCRENAIAITKIEEALLWLRKRTMGREQRGVEGMHKV
jgi:hypothetical protein